MDKDMKIKNCFLSYQPLRDIAVVSGQNARFECIVQAEPPPNILWSKNGRIIENSQNYQIQYRNGVCRLTIPHAYPGMYHNLCSKYRLWDGKLKKINRSLSM